MRESNNKESCICSNLLREPNAKSVLSIGSEYCKVLLHVGQKFNWFQKLMWRLFFGVKIDDLEEDTA